MPSKPVSKPKRVAFTMLLLSLLLFIPFSLLLFDADSNVTADNAQPATRSSFRSVLRPHLHNNALSHYSFHRAPVKDHLLEALSASHTDSVVVIGVSFGEELLRFARKGRRVFAFEPMPNSVELVRTAVHSTIPPLDVQLFEMAASDTTDDSDSFNVTYKENSVVVRTDRVDRYVPQSVDIAVMSVDIQGEELHAIKGASAFLSRVRSLWVEFKACGEHNLELLRYLDQNYVLFDFVPWGRAKHSDRVDHRDSFAFDVTRPADLEAYDRWFCQQKQTRYDWLQTDMLAVRRDLLDGEEGNKLLRQISNVHRKACANGDCVLREYVTK